MVSASDTRRAAPGGHGVENTPIVFLKREKTKAFSSYLLRTLVHRVCSPKPHRSVSLLSPLPDVLG